MKLIFHGKILHFIEVQWIKVSNLSASFSFLKEWLTKCTLFFIQKSQMPEMSLHVNKGCFSPPFASGSVLLFRDAVIVCWECSHPWEYLTTVWASSSLGTVKGLREESQEIKE